MKSKNTGLYSIRINKKERTLALYNAKKKHNISLAVFLRDKIKELNK